MAQGISFIGFGEAGRAFAVPGARAFDRKMNVPGERAALCAALAAGGVFAARGPAEALQDASAVLAVVTADQALTAARAYAPLLAPGALWLDMNSVAPQTKRAAQLAVENAGGRYVDVAVMAPVLPLRLQTPLLVAGANAGAAEERLAGIGFTNVDRAGARIGDAAAIKMIRSVMVKGVEALTAECLLAASRAGVTDAVLASLDAGRKGQSWVSVADYNLDRMLVHGKRRADEMEQAALTLIDLGVEPSMTRAAIARHREVGGLGVASPDGLASKLRAIDVDRRPS